jgi:hypothetical protein
MLRRDPNDPEDEALVLFGFHVAAAAIAEGESLFCVIVGCVRVG